MYIVIATNKRPKLAMRTVSSICECELPNSYRGAIVIENGTMNTSLQVYIKNVETKYNIQYVHSPFGNKSAALNQIISKIPYNNHIIMFDDDIILHPGTLLAYSEAINNHPECGYFGGPVLADYEKQPPLWLYPYLPSSARGWNLGSKSHETENTYFLGANWAFKKEESNNIMFNENIGPGSVSGARGQESAMQQSLMDCGSRGYYVSNAIVWHHTPATNCSPEFAIDRAYSMNITAFEREIKIRKKIPFLQICKKICGFIWCFSVEKGLKVFLSPKRYTVIKILRMKYYGYLKGMVLFSMKNKKS